MLKTLVLFLLICFRCVHYDAVDHHHLPHESIEMQITETKKVIVV